MGCDVVGVDSSSQQIEAACQTGLDARVKDCQALDFNHEFDAVFSNAALHWMKRADAVIEGVKRSLKPGGRFVAEMGRAGSCSGSVGRSKRLCPIAVSTASRAIRGTFRRRKIMEPGSNGTVFESILCHSLTGLPICRAS